MKPVSVVTVHLDFGGGSVHSVGRLALERSLALFEYDPNFAASKLRINPFMETSGLIRARATPFNGLHGIFADSLPDAWGQVLVRRRLEAEGVSYGSLTVLDKLSIVGHRGMGALIYDPQILNDVPHGRVLDPDALALESLRILRGESDGDVIELERLGGSSGGARPKISAFIDPSGRILSAPATGFEAWLIKFRHTSDFDDVGPLEVAYADMARAAGVQMAPTRLIPSSSCPGFFATKRFDREQEGAVRVHMASVAALQDIDWTVPGAIDYDNLLKIVRAVTREQPDVEQMFRRMVFNVLATNRDDHAKQHAFLMESSGRWKLAPAFDLGYAPGPNGQHYLDINGKGNAISLKDLHAVGEAHAIRHIDDVVDEVSDAIRQFSELTARHGVSDRTRELVASEIELRFRELESSRARTMARSGRREKPAR